MWDTFVVPLLIFLGGATYVGLDTVRFLFIGRGLRQLAALIGVMEVIVFLLAVGKVLAGPLEMVNVFAYALGFGAGTYIGIVIEGKLAMGYVVARVITQRDASELIEALRGKRYGITTVAARGLQERVRIIFSVIKRADMIDFQRTVMEFHPKAFVSFEDVRQVSAGYISPGSGAPLGLLRTGIGRWTQRRLAGFGLMNRHPRNWEAGAGSGEPGDRG